MQFLKFEKRFPEDGAYLISWKHLVKRRSYEVIEVPDKGDLNLFLEDLLKLKPKKINVLKVPSEVVITEEQK